jgi:hypothetical protein
MGLKKAGIREAFKGGMTGKVALGGPQKYI